MRDMTDPRARRFGQASTIMRTVLDRSLLFGAHGPGPRFHMTAAWAALGALGAVNAIWLSLSDLRLSDADRDATVRLILFIAIGLGLCGFVRHHLQHSTDRIGAALRAICSRIELLAVAGLVVALLARAIVTYCYLATAAALPLHDALLARMDRALGFDWIGFVQLANASASLSWLLVEAYRATPYVLTGTLLWLCISGRSGRLAELLALMCLTFIGIAIGTLLLPAEGAYAFHHPALEAYDNFGAGSGMWHHQLLMAIRSGAVRVIDSGTPNSSCLVTFPSGHTVLAIITTYALRDSRWTLIPALAVNGTMLVSTIPHGGHYLADVLAGATISACAIAAVRRPNIAHRPCPTPDLVLDGALRL